MNDGVLSIAAALCSEFEGCVLHPYLCPSGRWTIGIGCTRLVDGSLVTADTPPLNDDIAAMILLMTKLRFVADDVATLVHVPLNHNEAGALCSLVYNIGAGNFSTSSLLRFLNHNDRAGAADQFLVWDKAHVNGRLVALVGLDLRRHAERKVFLTAV